MARQSAGGRPSAAAAARNTSGAGLPRSTCPCTPQLEQQSRMRLSRRLRSAPAISLNVFQPCGASVQFEPAAKPCSLMPVPSQLVCQTGLSVLGSSTESHFERIPGILQANSYLSKLLSVFRLGKFDQQPEWATLNFDHTAAKYRLAPSIKSAHETAWQAPRSIAPSERKRSEGRQLQVGRRTGSPPHRRIRQPGMRPAAACLRGRTAWRQRWCEACWWPPPAAP